MTSHCCWGTLLFCLLSSTYSQLLAPSFSAFSLLPQSAFSAFSRLLLYLLACSSACSLPPFLSCLFSFPPPPTSSRLLSPRCLIKCHFSCNAVVTVGHTTQSYPWAQQRALSTVSLPSLPLPLSLCMLPFFCRVVLSHMLKMPPGQQTKGSHSYCLQQQLPLIALLP